MWWSHPSSRPCPPTAGNLCLEQGGEPESQLREVVVVLLPRTKENLKGRRAFLFPNLSLNKREKQVCEWLIRFASRSPPSPLHELSKRRQESCILSSGGGGSACAQGQHHFFEGKQKIICCFRAAISFLVLFKYLRVLHSGSPAPWTAARRSSLDPGPSICLGDQRPTPNLAGGW